MKSHHMACLSVLLVRLLVASASAQSGGCSAFDDVTVLPMDREQTLPPRTVLVRDGRIEQIAPARDLTIPHACYDIDGRGRYLIPGLVDSHVHLPLAGSRDQLLVLQLPLANGVTTAINMEGSPGIVALRDQVEHGAIIALRIYTTGPFIQQPAFMTADQVRKEVVSEKALGYDFIKVHGDLTKRHVRRSI